MKPKRIQRKRSKGWRMPPNTVYVGRPGKYGNPFKLMNDNLIHCDASHRRKILHPWVIFDNDNLWLQDTGLEQVVSLYKQWLAGWFGEGSRYHGIVKPMEITTKEILDDLRGKDLACWCPIMDKNGNHTPCHAEILLKIANS